jgi:hypothetical protein
MKFFPYLLNFSSDVDKIRHRRWPKKFFGHFDFRESRWSESHTLLFESKWVYIVARIYYPIGRSSVEDNCK